MKGRPAGAAAAGAKMNAVVTLVAVVDPIHLFYCLLVPFLLFSNHFFQHIRIINFKFQIKKFTTRNKLHIVTQYLALANNKNL